MKRLILLAAILVLIIGFTSWGIYRLLWTPDGVRWLFKGVTQYSPLNLSAERISGGLGRQLDLENIRLQWPEGQIRIEKMQTRLDPFSLLRGKIAFKKITLRRLDWMDQKIKTTPLELSLPKISGLLARVNLEIRSFHLDEINFSHLNEPALKIKRASGRLLWKHGYLAIDPLFLEGDAGRLEGSLGVGFSFPALQLNIRVSPSKPRQELDLIVVQSRLKSAWVPEQLAGWISIKGLSGNRELFSSRAELVIAPKWVQFTKGEFKPLALKGALHGQGRITLDPTGPFFETLFNFEGLDFSKEIGPTTSLSGLIHLTGRLNNYQGTFKIENRVRSWQVFRLAGRLSGNRSGLNVVLNQGDWLNGLLEGRLGIHWDQEFSLSASLQARQLRPEIIQSKWQGLVNLMLEGQYTRPISGRPHGRFQLDLLESRFIGKKLQGSIKALWGNSNLTIERAALEGRGFYLSGSGELSRRLNFKARVEDLSTMIPDSQGAFSTQGWVRWRNQRLAGDLFLEGKNLAWKESRIKGVRMDAALDQEKKNTAVEVTIRGRQLGFRNFSLDDLTGKAEGTLDHLNINLSAQGPQGKIQARINGALENKCWQGILQAFSFDPPDGSPLFLQSPAAIRIGFDRLHFSPILLGSKKGGKFFLEAELTPDPLFGFFRTEWEQIDLGRGLNAWEGMKLSGKTSGQLNAQFLEKGRMDLKAQASLTGIFQYGESRVDLKKGELHLSWDNLGLLASWALETKEGAKAWGEAVSQEKGRLGAPEKGTLQMGLEGVSMDLLKLKTLSGLRTQGKIRGRLQGNWYPGFRFSLNSHLEIDNGSLTWQEKDATITSQIKKAGLEASWAEDRLKGNLALELEGYGKVSGEFALPLPARIPLEMQSAGLVEIGVQGQVRENGLLTTLFPEALQTSQGKIKWDLAAKGTWEKPILDGRIELTEVGATLLPLGIDIKNVTAKGTFNQNRIEFQSLEMTSGPGVLKGQMTFWLQDWKIIRLKGKLAGNRFQGLHRPGVEVLISPDLDISGSPDHLMLHGVLEIPEALFSGGQPKGFKPASPDVVFIDRPASSEKEKAWPIYGEVRLRLGPQVRVKAEGLDALVSGGLNITLQTTKEIKAQGEVDVVKGHYLLQGQRLDITRGRFSFKNSPSNPFLDLQAIRTIRQGQELARWEKEIRVGITVTGPLKSPLVKLYSQPPLSETDTFSYLLFGEPLKPGTDKQNLILLSKAAGTLLGGNVQGGLARRFNLDTLEIQTGGGDFSRSVITVGKYLDPRLFFGLGGSLFGNSYHLILRYALTPNIEIETRGGSSSGGTIFYKIEFE
jgi:translocation and assembly module TamB